MKLSIAAVVLCAGLLGACGSSPRPAAAGSAVEQTCEAVSAVLSNGPDPSADPVGYAEAQTLLPRKVHTSDAALRSALNRLASAYGSFFHTDGSKAAKTAVVKASATLDAICPGAAS